MAPTQDRKLQSQLVAAGSRGASTIPCGIVGGLSTENNSIPVVVVDAGNVVVVVVLVLVVVLLDVVVAGIVQVLPPTYAVEPSGEMAMVSNEAAVPVKVVVGGVMGAENSWYVVTAGALVRSAE
jgi:hypothetical protein